MSLAQRLNDLARANSDGLLNDDEYRLLRQSAFELYAVAPTQAPASPSRALLLPTEPRVPSSPRVLSSSSSQPPPPSSSSSSRTKSSVASGVASLLRRATGRRTPTTTHRTPTPAATPNNDPTTKRGILPRILQKKPADLAPIRTESASVPRDPSSPRLAHVRSQPSLSLTSPTPSSPRTVPAPSILDEPGVFDDENLHTSKDIRRAIAATEAELHRLLDAFRSLEDSTHQRLQHQNAHRLPPPLLEGREWRKQKQKHISPPTTAPIRRADPTDGASIRSGSSTLTTLSQSKSIFSFSRQQPPSSPSSSFSPHFRTPSFSLRRKNSMSSVSSQSTSPRLGVIPNTSTSWSKSTGHLPLGMLAESDALQEEEDEDVDPEVADVRKRREEVRTRYAARLHYLHAKLKGAELHEKLLRK